MRTWGVMVVVSVGAGCFGGTVPISIPGFSSNPYTARERAERRAADDLMPVELEVPDGVATVTKVFKVRAWVDADYRAKPRWRAELQDLITRAGAYAAPAFGARFDIDIHTWDRSGEASMDEMLSQLIELDPGDDTDWVVGFVTAPKGVATDYHLIGLARTLSKHFVLRDMNDAEEARALEEEFRKLSPEEKGELYAARKRHKLLSVFLHEWGHTLGHPHEKDPSMIMSATQSNRSSRYSPVGAQLMRAGVAWRAGGPQSQAALADVRRILQNNAEGWSEMERAQDVDLIDHGWVADSGREPPAPRGVTVTATPVAAPAPRVEEKAPPNLRLPNAASVATLAPPPAANAAPAGQTVSDVVRRAYDKYEVGDHAGARAELETVRARLAPGSSDAQNALQIYLAIGALTRVGELLDVGRGRDPARDADSRKTLSRLIHDTGLGDPQRSGVSAEDEPEAYGLFVDGVANIAAENLDVAEARRRALAKRFPRALPTLILSCAVEAAANKLPAARKDCAAALARWDELSYAHFWAGQSATATKDRIAHHRRTLEIDPDQEGSWQALAALYRQTKDRAAEAALRTDFEAHFGRRLPQ